MACKAPFSRNLKELRMTEITGKRDSQNYTELKNSNPSFPTLIRECSGTEPQVWARCDFGVEKGIRLDGLTEQQISQVLRQLAKAVGSTKS